MRELLQKQHKACVFGYSWGRRGAYLVGHLLVSSTHLAGPDLLRLCTNDSFVEYIQMSSCTLTRGIWNLILKVSTGDVGKIFFLFCFSGTTATARRIFGIFVLYFFAQATLRALSRPFCVNLCTIIYLYRHLSPFDCIVCHGLFPSGEGTVSSQVDMFYTVFENGILGSAMP